MSPPIVALLGFGAFFVICIGLFLRADAAISDLYSTDRKRWQELGGPIGFFWRPKEKLPFFASVRARNAISLTAMIFPSQLRRSPNEKKA